MNILITGGCGFIGSHLVDYYLHHGANVLALDNLSSGSKDNVRQHLSNPNFKLEIADMLTWDGLIDAIKWSDCIFHMAAVVGIERVLEDPLSTLEINFNTNQKLLSLTATIKNMPRIFVASSSMVYGEQPATKLKETDTLHIKSAVEGHWIYAVSKLAVESLAASYFEMHQIPVTTMRIFNTIGPRQSSRYGMVVPRFVQAACRGNDITVYGDGTQSRSFCDVRDLVQCLNLLTNTSESIGKIINVGNNNTITIADLAHLVKNRAASQSNITYIPYKIAYHKNFTDIKHRAPDLTKLMAMTDFKPQWSLDKTIDDLISHFNHKT